MAFLEPASTRSRTNRQRAIKRITAPLSREPMVQNIINVFEQANDEEFEAGVAWYGVAHEIAIDLGLGAKTGAGVIAALSPQLGWAPNIAAAVNLVKEDNPRPAGIGPFIEKARRIRDGEEPEAVLGGRKVRSFYRNILYPGRPGPVTVDRHAVSVATDIVDIRALDKTGFYQMVAAAYRGAGRLLNLYPHQAQAITWLTYRRLLDEQGARGIRT